MLVVACAYENDLVICNEPRVDITTTFMICSVYICAVRRASEIKNKPYQELKTKKTNIGPRNTATAGHTKPRAGDAETRTPNPSDRTP